ncbi:MAG: OmpH family outer membrane protein [Gammaproteobacteria bacterium]
MVNNQRNTWCVEQSRRVTRARSFGVLGARNVIVRFLMLCVLASVSSLGAAKDLKVAVLDYGAALLRSDRAQKMADEVKKDLKKEEKRILALESELKTMSEKAERDGPVMSSSQKNDLMKEIEDKKLDYGFLIKKFQKRQKEGRDEIVKALQPDLGGVIESVVKSGGYDLVLERGGVVYVGEAYDITDKVVKALNKVLDKK